MRITPHFTLAEVEKSHTAIRYGIDNTLPRYLIPAATAVAENILEPCRLHFGKPISPTSWYRCLELNRVKNGSVGSQHMKAEAVDFEIAGVSNLALAKWIRDNCEFDQLILEFYKDGEESSGWVHCSYSLSRNRKDVKRTPDGKTYIKGLE